MNVSTSRWKKVGEGSGGVPWQTHRMYEKEMGIPKLPFWSMACNRCWFIWSLFSYVGEMDILQKAVVRHAYFIVIKSEVVDKINLVKLMH